MTRLALLLTLAVLPAAAWAQGIPPTELPPGAGFAWEAVGDRAVNPSDLTFAPDGALWAVGSGVHRLSPVGPGGVWDRRAEFATANALLVLGTGAEGDTVLTTRGITQRSVDGGRTFTQVHSFGRYGPIEGPAGRLFVGSGSAAAHSDDRGATWVEAESFPPNQSGESLLTLPPEPGRAAWHVLSGLIVKGVAVSADSGRTFVPSSLWGVHTIAHFTAVDRPGGPAGARRVLAVGRTTGEPNARVWASDDGGLTWGEPVLLRDVADPGAVSYEREAGILPLGGASALVVLGRGTVHRTDDGGLTWSVVGRTPIEGTTEEEIARTSVKTAVIGPDGRLYVGQIRTGCCYRPFVYRTADPLTVANEGGPTPTSARIALRAEPNPSAGAVALFLTLPEAETSVRVAVYDGLGREVAVAHDGALGAGPHRLPLNTRGLAPGVYVARAETGSGAATARLAVAR